MDVARGNNYLAAGKNQGHLVFKACFGSTGVTAAVVAGIGPEQLLCVIVCHLWSPN